mmetsp:Transcript_125914/g.187949  ORF Transcript_125914/g.187949 Transcript_125914/m.187949 type:complete len:262 (-) Transcript_125914:106-891(-)|eukprot:CAMPEP_0117003370 /NCGR_PEP_ID=MMETSP0472-20121206/4709_1 /TAXON_ID=693140 ORGANISM="Tiarina fusus, Strain LIS" /NCGR_SAMPLE_ID=MMETSP0472 /ASSEMBLY_ACC=CAM_ASM_000603 /LENGTH=261 /DNA_ID=CAMNT_0004703989 /DNA_START=75 /DNA_END=860 /DNA_ORIENTATION=-
MSAANDDDQALFMADFGMEIPCWMLQAAPVVFFVAILWGVGRLSSRRESQFVWPWQKRRSRKEAMDQGFAKTVDSVAKQVKSSGRRNGSGHRVKPLAGKYKCVMRYQDIISRHDSTPLFAKQTPVAYFMTLEVLETPDGFSLEGHRIDGNGHRWEVEESHINCQGQTYWVERSADTRILAHGKFANTKVFEGEWMVSDGLRGKYSEFVYIPPATTSSRVEVHVGVPVEPETASLLTRLFRSMWPRSGRGTGTAVSLAAETV